MKKLINCYVSKNIRKHKLTTYLMDLCYFFSHIYKYLNRYWANQLDIYINKKDFFYSHAPSKKYGIPLLARFSILHYQKNMKGQTQAKRSKCHSLLLLCLKINCINIRTKSTKYLPSASKTTQSSFAIISASHFDVCNLLSYFHNGRIWICRYQGVMWMNNVKRLESFS